MPAEFVNPPALSKPTGYAHVAIVPAGRQVHVSGQVSINAAGEIVGVGDVAAQAEQVYHNLKAALEGAGASIKDVAKIVTYVVDLTPERAAAARGPRLRAFGDGPYPASTMVGVTSLVHPDLLIEVEAIAILP